MNYSYPAIIHHEDASYWIEFPDLDGCHTFTESLDTLFDAAAEALSAHLSTLIDIGEIPPKPTAPDDIVYAEGDMITIVKALVQDKKRAVKKTLTLPAWLNTEAERRGINFSQTLQEALLAKLEQ